MRSPALALFAVLLVGQVAFAQSERYELGARMKAFEAEWDKQTDKDARKRALAVVGDVTTQFLTFQLANETFGLEILRVQEIRGYTSVTALQDPHNIRGNYGQADYDVRNYVSANLVFGQRVIYGLSAHHRSRLDGPARTDDPGVAGVRVPEAVLGPILPYLRAVEHISYLVGALHQLAYAMGGGVAGLFRTHPPTEERIARLLAMAR